MSRLHLPRRQMWFLGIIGQPRAKSRPLWYHLDGVRVPVIPTAENALVSAPLWDIQMSKIKRGITPRRGLGRDQSIVKMIYHPRTSICSSQCRQWSRQLYLCRAWI